MPEAQPGNGNCHKYYLRYADDGEFYREPEGGNLGDLSNDIHPIFRRRNFPAVNYDALIPSLRLASKLLTDESLLPWWHAIWYGWWEMVPNSDKNGEGAMYRYGRTGKLSARDIAMTKLQLQMMSDYVRFFPSDKMGTKVPQFASADSCGYRLGNMINHEDISGCAVDIEYASYYTNTLAQEDRYSSVTRLKTRFAFATILLHELSHAAQFFAIPEHQLRHEHFFEDETVAEAGCAWEKFVFGDALCSEFGEWASVERDGSWEFDKYGRQLIQYLESWPAQYPKNVKPKDWPCAPVATLGLQPLPEIEMQWRVEVGFIEKLFTTAFWDVEVREKGASALRPPREIGVRYSNRQHHRCEGYGEDGIPEDCYMDEEGNVYPYVKGDWAEWEGFGRLLKIDLAEDISDPYTSWDNEAQNAGWGDLDPDAGWGDGDQNGGWDDENHNDV
ncbi:hypothetical protein NA57DRAFT_71584 [Rhizodiscina lignyota]|uniref:Uncharacterized protein n=1 Tax=Rhizodiscina lignyota TaxID=1504668 RepID=A0A9P4M9D0_9PEZI|nr:hypothetical protein NA57DRAFT_71584 [Rhizodiscina lignyota]